MYCTNTPFFNDLTLLDLVCNHKTHIRVFPPVIDIANARGGDGLLQILEGFSKFLCFLVFVLLWCRRADNVSTLDDIIYPI